MSDTPRTDKLAQEFLLTWNQFAYRSDEDIAKQCQNTDDAIDLARQLERELAEAIAQRDKLKKALTTMLSKCPSCWGKGKVRTMLVELMPCRLCDRARAILEEGGK